MPGSEKVAPMRGEVEVAVDGDALVEVEAELVEPDRPAVARDRPARRSGEGDPPDPLPGPGAALVVRHRRAGPGRARANGRPRWCRFSRPRAGRRCPWAPAATTASGHPIDTPPTDIPPSPSPTTRLGTGPRLDVGHRHLGADAVARPDVPAERTCTCRRSAAPGCGGVVRPRAGDHLRRPLRR